MARSRVALIAIQQAPGGRAKTPRAILVGTKEGAVGDLDWRYACWPLDKLQSALGVVDDLLEPPPDVQDSHAPVDVLGVAIPRESGLMSKRELKHLIERAGFKKSYLDAKISAPGGLQPTRRQSAIVFRDIEQVYFFTYDNGALTNSKVEDSPFALFDVARHLDLEDKTDYPHAFNDVPPEERPVGSRLVLFPNWNLHEAGRPGALSAMAVQLSVKVAANGHKGTIGSDETDRYDTRMVFDLRLQDKGPDSTPKPLWKPRSDADTTPIGHRGIRFDEIRFRCSEAPEGDLSPIKALTENDLISLTEGGREKRSHWERVDGIPAPEWDFSPALRTLGLQKEVTLIEREFGLRALQVTTIRPQGEPAFEATTKIGWRFEATLEKCSSQMPAAASLLRAIPQDLLAALDNGAHKLSNMPVLLAEEQRVSDIRMVLGNPPVRRTLLTLRLDARDDLGDFDLKATRAVLDRLNQATKVVQAGLKAVHDGGPLSLLPELAASDNNQGAPWHFGGTVFDRAAGARNWATKKNEPPPATWDAVVTTFEPRAIFDMWKGLSAADQIRFTAKAELRRFLTADRKTPKFAARLGWLKKTGARVGEDAECTKRPAYQPAISGQEPAEALAGVRLSLLFTKRESAATDLFLGALSLKLADEHADANPLPGFLHLKPLPLEKGFEDQLDCGLVAEVRLPVAEAQAANEDELPGASSAADQDRYGHLPDQDVPDPGAPLVFLLEEPGSPPAAPGEVKARLTLVAEEVSTRDRTHAVSLSLRGVQKTPPPRRKEDQEEVPETSSAPVGKQRALLIEPQPFRVMAVDYDDITGEMALDSFELAVWSSATEEGTSWQIPDPAQNIRLIAPPQVVGEAMEKNRAGRGGRPPDITPDRPSAARFGSLTTLNIDPTFEDRNFREPGWNLQRILGRAGQRSPGARLLDLRTELLYGMVTRVRAPDLWMTEISGAIGRQPTARAVPGDKGVLDRHATLVGTVLKAAQRRLAVEKVWRKRPDEDLVIDEGVTFKLRHRPKTAAGGPATRRVPGPRTQLRWPTPGDVPADTGSLIDPELLKQTFSTDPDDGKSFPGGLSWAFESPNILMSVYGRPQSDGGSVAGLHLTALGGYGSQRALFDQRKTIVESVTTQGRVHRYRLERVGRISCLWNRAKHVIVYERTVTPSAQFYNTAPIGLKQDELLGRAVLRKVEEYVEIMQPVRRYPEDGASVSERGFLLGSDFKSTRIRVDSEWGADVRREGWRVPLWNTDFLGLKPDNPNNPDDPALIYPKPQIQTTLAGEHGEVAYEVSEPEKLFFYTSVIDGEDDNTDAWQAVRGVDFADLPFPTLASVETRSEDLTDTPSPGEPAQAPGYEPFTLAIASAGEPVAVTHGRIEGGPVAVLRNFTIARASPLAAPSAPDNNPDQVRRIGKELAARSANVRAEVDQQINRIVNQLDQLNRVTDPTKLAEQANALIERTAGKLDLTKVLEKTKDDFKKIDVGINGGARLCDGLVKNIEAQAQGQLNRLLNGATEFVRFQVDSARVSVAQAAETVDGVARDMLERVDEAQAQRAALEQKFDEADSAEARKRARERAQEFVAALKVQVDDLKGGAKARVAKQITEADAAIGGLAADARAELAELRSRLKADVKGIRSAVSSGIDEELKRVRAQLADLHDEIGAAAEAIENFGAELDERGRKAAHQLRARFQDAREALKDAVCALEKSKAPAAARGLLQMLEAALNRADVAAAEIERGKLGTAVEGCVKTLREAKDVLGSTVVAVSDRLLAFESESRIESLVAEVTKLRADVESAAAALEDVGPTLNEKGKDVGRRLWRSFALSRLEWRDAERRLVKAEATPAELDGLKALKLADVDVAVRAVRDGATGVPVAPLVNALRVANDALAAPLSALPGALAKFDAEGPLGQLERIINGILDTAAAEIEALISNLDEELFKPLGIVLAAVKSKSDGAIDAAAAAIEPLFDKLSAATNSVWDAQIPDEAKEAVRDLDAVLKSALGDIRLEVEKVQGEAANARRLVEAALAAALRTVEAEVRKAGDAAAVKVTEMAKAVTDTCNQIEDKIREALKKPAEEIGKLIDDALGVSEYGKDLAAAMQAAISDGAVTVEEIKAKALKAADDYARTAEARARQVAGSIQESARELIGIDPMDVARRAEGIYQRGDAALRAIRAIGEPPRQQGIGFTKEQVGYVLQAKKLGVDVTPALALVNRAADQVAAAEKAGQAVGELLDSFGVRLPVSELTAQLVPDQLKDLSVADLLPDMGGIDFRGLLSEVGFPDLDDSKAVKIRHGGDKGSLSAWMEASLNIPFVKPATLFHFGPVEVAVMRAEFESEARMTLGPDGMTKEMHGRIFGDWRVACGGQTILTFRQTALTFEADGSIDFRIQPERVEIAEALKFITDLMKATGQKGGLNVEPFMRGGIPSGVAATLDMVLPPIQTGVFGIQDLSIHILFGIAALPEFELVCELSVGTRIAPFTLNIWILNGGGWLTQTLSYLPTRTPQPLLTYHLEIGIAVGLGIGFSFGVVSGGIWLQVGCSLLVDWRTGSGGNTTAMRVFILLRGMVDVMGLITAYLLLMVDVVYDGQQLIGHGTMTFEVRISVFYTLSVSEHVQYVFAGGGGESEEEGSGSDAYG